MFKYNDSVVIQYDTVASGNAGAGAKITVYLTGTTTKAPLFQDNEITPLDNPVTADNKGNYCFNIADGVYDLVINKGQLTETDINGVQMASMSFGATVRFALQVSPGVTVYPLPEPLSSENVVVVDGEILRPDAYSTNIGGDLILAAPLYNTGLMFEVWNKMPVALTISSISAKTFNLIRNVSAASLRGVNVVTTRNGAIDGDNFGATFSSTGIIDTENPGVIDVGRGVVYDSAGRQFKFEGVNIALEQMGVSYNEPAANVLAYLVALRQNGFKVDLSARYNLTTFNGQYFVRNNQKEVIIHRGMKDYAPENTLLAWSMAFNRTKAQNIAFEVDVQISSDGVPVCFHNLSVDETTDGTGDVVDLTLAQLKALNFNDVVGTAFEGNVTIPTFKEFCRFASYCGVKIYPEIKAYRTPEDIKIFNDIVREYRLENQTVYSSFRVSDLEKMREYNQQSGWAWATPYPGPYTQSDIDRLSVLGNYGTIWQSLNQWNNNPVDIDIFHSYGFDVGAYTVNRKSQMQELSDLGISKFNADSNVLASADMTSVISQRRFNQQPWNEQLTGGGSATYLANPENGQPAGEIVQVESDVGSSAILNLPFNYSAGENLVMQVFACNLEGHADEAQILTDAPGRIDNLDIIGTDWIEYQVSIQADFNESYAAYLGAFRLTTSSTRDAGAKFYRPILKSANSVFGSNRVLMQGYLVIAEGGVAGAHSLKTDQQQYNVDEESISASGNNITIRAQSELRASGGYGKFSPFAQITAAPNGQDAEPIYFEATTSGSTGQVFIYGHSLTSGAAVDLNKITSEHRVYFKVEM